MPMLGDEAYVLSRNYTDKKAAAFNGSPKGVYATLTALQTAFPTGTSGVYLVTADGNWYYWSGSTWTSGGTYQATGIADKSITTKKASFITEEARNLFFTSEATDGNRLSATGTNFADAAYAVSGYIPVTAGQTYDAVILGTASASIIRVAQYDASKVFTALLTMKGPASKYVTFTATATGFIRIDLPLDKKSQFMVVKAGVKKDISNYHESLSGSLSDGIYATGNNLLSGVLFVDGYFMSETQNIGASATYKFSDYIPVTAGQTYYYKGYTAGGTQGRGMRYVTYFNSNGVLVAGGVSTLQSSFTVPAGVAYVIVTVDAVDVQNVLSTDSAISRYVNDKVIKQEYLPEFDANANPLKGKKLLGFGDSIIANTGNPVGKIGERNSMTYNNYAVGGATVTVISGNTNNLLTRINDAITANVQADYIIFDGLTNDASSSVAVGAISTGYNAVLDTATFCGAFETICKTLKVHWLGAKILYIRPHNMDSRGTEQVTLGDLALQMCKKWSIPVVDMYNEGGLNTQIPQMKLAYTVDTYSAGTGDGTHPNDAGYDLYYVPRIEAKLKSI